MNQGESVGVDQSRSMVVRASRTMDQLGRLWYAIALVLLWLWVGIPWLAPVFMRIGWNGPANLIYFLYSFQCHQLPQRSFFLFGDKVMYALEDIQRVWDGGANPLLLRQFVGNPEMGFKVAWSDRMVSAYGSIPLAATLWGPLRRKIKPLSLLAFTLLALPMAIDGSTHFLSDFAGLGQGFRYTNGWLANLTNHSLSASFYAGNALGSFNSWMRLITGTLFGFGLVWYAFPYLRDNFLAQSPPSEGEREHAIVEQ